MCECKRACHCASFAGGDFSGSTRVKLRFSLNNQNHPSESARRSRVIHHGHVRNMRQCGRYWLRRKHDMIVTQPGQAFFADFT